MSVADQLPPADGRGPARTTMIASALVATGGTLAVAAAAGSLAPAGVGVAAGGCLAAAVRATAVAERREGTLLGGALGTVGGVLVLVGLGAAVAVQVSWPPVPPVPYLAAAPFVALLAGVLAGFGTLAAVQGLDVTSHAGTAGTRLLAVGVVTGALVVALLDPRGALLLVVAIASGLAIVAPYMPRDGWADVPPVAAAVSGVTLAAAAVTVHGPVERFVVGTASGERGRWFVRAVFEAFGAPTLVLAAVAAGASLAAAVLLLVGLGGRLGLLDGTGAVQLASAGALVAAVAAGIAEAHAIVVLAGVAASLLTWDLGEFAVTLGREVGDRSGTRRVELLHTATAVGVAAVAAVAAGATTALVAVVPQVPGDGAIVAGAAATVGTLLLVLVVE